MKIETVVVTGGIGSGKSSVIEMIKQTSEVKVDFFNLMIILMNYIPRMKLRIFW